MKKIKVDFCETNVQYRSRGTFELLRKERKDLEVREWGCLGNCELCDTGPYAIVGDTFVQAATDAELLVKVDAVLAAKRSRPG